MNSTGFAVPAIVLFASLVVWGAVTPPAEEERVKGTVVAATATYCEPKKTQGCTGTLTLDSHDETRVIRIPLGTPITDGCEVLPFGDLPGKRVVVTQIDDASGPVARAISADAPPAGAC